MSTHVPVHLAAEVRERAGQRCEYCLLPQSSQGARFHLDHIQPQIDGGQTKSENLAMACVTCSLKKAARTHALDPDTLRIVRLFHPRRDQWAHHFQWTADWRAVGKTSTGRATILALGINRPDIVHIRQGLAKLGRIP